MDRPGRAAIRDSHVTKTRFLGKTDEVQMWRKSSPSSTDLDLSSWRPSQSQPNIKASEKGWCQWPRDIGANLQGMPLAWICVKLMGGEKGQEAHVQILWKLFIKLPLGLGQRWVENSVCGSYLSWTSLKLMKNLAQGYTQDWQYPQNPRRRCPRTILFFWLLTKSNWKEQAYQLCV